MTKEQEEAISRLRKITNRQILYGNKYGITIEGFREVQEDIETVLNMLKEKDTEIEKLKQDLIIRKKDRQIDLMAERLRYDEDLKYEVCKDCEPLKEELCGEPKKTQYEPTELECVKQYFERKVEKE